MSDKAIEDLPMIDLVELFKKQVSLYGVSKCIRFLKFDGTDDSTSDADDTDVRNIQAGNGDDSSDDSSVDVFSDDSFDDGSESESNSSDEDSLYSGDDQSDEGSVHGAFPDGGVIHLHEPQIFVSLHCPPFPSINNTLHGECDCLDFGMEVCGRTDEFDFFAVLNLVEEYNQAVVTVDSIDRIPANLLRKRLYKMLLHATDFGIFEKNERRKLPNCAVARIRQIYPSITGDYMGFKEN